jgi:hypothetical protein
VILAAAAAARDAVLLLESVAPDQHEQLVVGGLGLLGVLVDRRLVDEQQLGQHRALLLDRVGVGLDLHAVLGRPQAGRGVDARADVDHAHAADADGVVAVVVTEDRDFDAERLGGIEDGRPLGDRDLSTVDGQGDGAGLSRGGSGDRHDSLSPWSLAARKPRSGPVAVVDNLVQHTVS